MSNLESQSEVLCRDINIGLLCVGNIMSRQGVNLAVFEHVVSNERLVFV